MDAPTFHIDISGSVVAAYAAVVSTMTGFIQLSNFLRDRARIKLTARHKMKEFGAMRLGAELLTIITVTNTGRRPVTITGVGALCLHPHDPFVFQTCKPPLPHELTEGKHLNAMMAEGDFDFSTIDRWEAYDAVGRTHRLRVASWRAHTLSNFKRRLQWRREAAKKRKLI
jgi:hypothetical protein